MNFRSILCFNIILLFFIRNTFAVENTLFVKGGISAGTVRFSDVRSNESKFVGYGFNTQFGYIWEDFEFNLESTVTLGSFNNAQLETKEGVETFTGDYRNIVLTPQPRLHFKAPLLKENWKAFFGIGPAFSLQSLIVEDNTSVNPAFREDKKITYESVGYSVTLGVVENLKFNEMHPVYIEINYLYLRSTKVSLVDTSNFTAVKTVSTSENQRNVVMQSILVNFGITVF